MKSPFENASNEISSKTPVHCMGDRDDKKERCFHALQKADACVSPLMLNSKSHRIITKSMTDAKNESIRWVQII